jgi:hypothetical protein
VGPRLCPSGSGHHLGELLRVIETADTESEALSRTRQICPAPHPRPHDRGSQVRTGLARGVISGCAGPSAARQVNLNKRTQPREPERAYLAIRHAPAG